MIDLPVGSQTKTKYEPKLDLNQGSMQMRKEKGKTTQCIVKYGVFTDFDSMRKWSRKLVSKCI